jgi:hypothetical protein
MRSLAREVTPRPLARLTVKEVFFLQATRTGHHFLVIKPDSSPNRIIACSTNQSDFASRQRSVEPGKHFDFCRISSSKQHPYEK